MGRAEPEFTVGIEEEYLLVDKATRQLASDPPEGMLAECQELTAGQVTPEFLRSQIEVGTHVCRTLGEAREDLARLRKTIVDVADSHGLAPIAASTHPSAMWTEQKFTEQERYAALASEMQAAARRMLICGMHVHVGIDNDELRIDLMNQLSYFLPHLLAMSSSSPFFEGDNTGLMSYRVTIFDAMPRTGLPERFASFAEYERHVRILKDAKLIEDSSKIWWDLRPSARYPTLETRMMDVCTDIDDAVSLAALVVCLLRMLYRLRLDNQRWRIYTPMLIRENRWRAMRYSFDEGLLDLARGEIVPFPQILEEILTLVREDAAALDCETEIERLPEILNRGTSAHQQIACYNRALSQGASREDALAAVVDHLIDATQARL